MNGPEPKGERFGTQRHYRRPHREIDNQTEWDLKDNPTTTWGDCPNPECRHYGVMRYGIEPGAVCREGREDDYDHDDDGCGSTLRWWDRWHDGKHRGERGIDECRAERTA